MAFDMKVEVSGCWPGTSLSASVTDKKPAEKSGRFLPNIHSLKPLCLD